MTKSLALAVCALCLIVAAPPATVPAAPGQSLAGLLPARTLGQVQQQRSRIARIRRLAASPRILQLARAALAASRARAVPGAATHPTAASASGSLRGAFGRAVGRLGAVVRRSSQSIGHLTARQMRRAVRTLGHRAAASPRIARAVRALPGAMIDIAAALDDVLVTAPRRGGSANAAVDGCDKLDRLPLLCIGSEADNTYTQDAALLIDLGGNDTYENSAGGAPFPVQDGAAFEPVSVNVDLGGGSDVYESELGGWTGGVAFGAGAGGPGSLGILVDQGGDDTYSATSPPAAINESGYRLGPSSMVIAQGGGNGGMGVLFDLGGSDRYTVTGRDGVADYDEIGAQGGGNNCWRPGYTTKAFPAGCAVGALVDVGRGDDTYAIDAKEVSGSDHPDIEGGPTRFVAGQGGGYLGAGFLYDDGGSDAFSVSGGSSGEGMESTNPATVPKAVVVVQGSTTVGTGLLLEGDGPTTYDVRLSGRGLALEAGFAQGAADGGLSVLADKGGDDTYTLDTRVDDVVSQAVTDDCGCPTDAELVFDPRMDSAGVSLGAQGMAIGGLGVLLDHAGDDAYVATGTQSVSLSVADERQTLDGPVHVRAWPLVSPAFSAQGTAAIGTGVLLDGTGTDRYDAGVTNALSVDATSSTDGPVPQVLGMSMLNPHASFRFQGTSLSGVGALLDMGGSLDTFWASASNPVTLSPDGSGARRYGGIWPPFQGQAEQQGVGILVALGHGSVVQSDPSRPPCLQEAGWGDCAEPVLPGEETYDEPAGYSPSYALVSEPLALTPTSLTFGGATSQTAATDGSADVDAVLHDAAGAPIGGRLVHFVLQWQTVRPTEDHHWMNGWEVDAVSDDTGHAVASLPVRLHDEPFLSRGSVCFSQQCSYRILAMFTGSTTLAPAYAWSPLEVS